MKNLSDEKKYFKKLFLENEEWLMSKILFYAEKYDFTKYTSTLKEAWRVSIEGLTSSFAQLLDQYETPPELNPDDDYSSDPASSFGLIEAQKHRSRGVNLAMFLGLFKYYRQCYHDLLNKNSNRFENIETFTLFIDRFFDRMEIAYCSEWAGLSSEKQIQELSRTNLNMTNEKNKYLTIFDSFGSPVAVLDREGNLENLNYKAEQIFDTNKTSGGLYYKEGEHKKFYWLEEEINSFINLKSENISFEKTYEPKGLIFDIKLSKLNDVSNKFVGYTVLMNDITPIKKAQEEVKKAVTKQLEQEKILLRQSKLAAMGEMTSMIAHQWRQPIASIAMTANNMLADYELEIVKSEDYEFYANDILDQTKYLSTTIDDFKDFFKPSGDKELVDIKDTINATLMLIIKTLQNHDIEIIKELEDVGKSYIFKNELSHVLINIIKNADEALVDKEIKNKQIFIKSYKKDHIFIEIEDNGGGISPKHMEKIFNPYFTTKDKLNGTGIGLYMSKMIIEEHMKGSISAGNTKEGAKFVITLPLS